MLQKVFGTQIHLFFIIGKAYTSKSLQNFQMDGVKDVDINNFTLKEFVIYTVGSGC